jgi:hypothetical protein
VVVAAAGALLPSTAAACPDVDRKNFEAAAAALKEPPRLKVGPRAGCASEVPAGAMGINPRRS